MFFERYEHLVAGWEADNLLASAFKKFSDIHKVRDLTREQIIDCFEKAMTIECFMISGSLGKDPTIGEFLQCLESGLFSIPEPMLCNASEKMALQRLKMEHHFDDQIEE